MSSLQAKQEGVAVGGGGASVAGAVVGDAVAGGDSSAADTTLGALVGSDVAVTGRLAGMDTRGGASRSRVPTHPVSNNSNDRTKKEQRIMDSPDPERI